MSIRIALVGAGSMGANHVRLLSQMDGVRLVGVVDVDLPRAERLAEGHGCLSASRLEELGEPLDAVVIATPPETHLEMGLAAIELGMHLLVEKPLAVTSSDAEELRSAAERAGRVLAVGHVERFNPVCLDLPRFLSSPSFVQARRLSPYTENVREGVVRDMMIHDLDLVLWIAGSLPTEVRAVSARTRSETEDLAVATLTFPSGVIAQLTATRIGQDKVRRLDVLQDDCVLDLDLLRQDLTIRRQASVEYPEGGARRLRESSVIEIPYLEHRGEPLDLELRDFVRAVAEGRPPLVDGRAGVAAVRACEMVLSAAGER